MKFEIKPLVRPICLSEYAEEYGEQVIWVWVNQPRAVRVAHAEIVSDFEGVVEERRVLTESGDEVDDQAVAEHGEKLDELSRRLYGWFADVWSRHPDEETHWTADDVDEMVDACLDADPRLWSWIQSEHWRLITEHREGVKKK